MWEQRIKFFGLGTEKVAALTAEAFPEARLLRWDRDVTQTKGAHELILDRFIRREADILVGTQMVAKGLDLPSRHRGRGHQRGHRAATCPTSGRASGRSSC